jgi:hypothetical protein
MAKNTFRSALDNLSRAFRSKDEKKIEEAMKEADAAAEEEEAGTGGAVVIHNHPPMDAKKSGDAEKEEEEKKKEERMKNMEDAIKKIGDSIEEMKKSKEADNENNGGPEANKKILAELEMEAPPGSGDKARRAKDSEFLSDSYQRTVADAEIIAPGLRVPTFDRAAAPATSFDAICQMRRRALDVAMLQPEIRTLIDNISNGRGFDSKTATCDSTRMMFNAAVAMKRQMNNSSSVSNRVADLAGKGSSGPMSIAELNKINAARRGDKVA